MPYLNCPRCGLSVRVQADFLMMRNCPRCLARSASAIPLYETPAPVQVAFLRRARRRTAPEGEPPGA